MISERVLVGRAWPRELRRGKMQLPARVGATMQQALGISSAARGEWCACTITTRLHTSWPSRSAAPCLWRQMTRMRRLGLTLQSCRTSRKPSCSSRVAPIERLRLAAQEVVEGDYGHLRAAVSWRRERRRHPS